MSEDAHEIATPRDQNIDELAAKIHELEKSQGWVEHDQDMREVLAIFLANQTGEMAELWEAYRKGEYYGDCDKADAMRQYGFPVLSCMEEEIADMLIRILGFCERNNIKPSYIIAVKHAFNKTRKPRHGGKLA